MPRKPTIHIRMKRPSRTTQSTPKVVRKVTLHHHTPIFIQRGQICGRAVAVRAVAVRAALVRAAAATAAVRVAAKCEGGGEMPCGAAMRRAVGEWRGARGSVEESGGGGGERRRW